MRGVARELGTQPASRRTQVLCLGSRTCGDQVASRLLMQGFLTVAEEAAWCMGVPERCPHPVKRQLAQSCPPFVPSGPCGRRFSRTGSRYWVLMLNWADCSKPLPLASFLNESTVCRGVMEAVVSGAF